MTPNHLQFADWYERSQLDAIFLTDCFNVVYQTQGNIDDGLDRLLQLACQRFHAWAASIRWRDPDYHSLFFHALVADQRWQPEWTLRRQAISKQSAGGTVILTGRPQLNGNVRHTKLPFEHFSDVTQSMCSVPILLRGHVEGVLSLDCEYADMLNVHTLDILTTLAQMVSHLCESNAAIAERQLRADILNCFAKPTPQPPYGAFVKVVQNILRAEHCSLFVRGNDPNDPYLLQASTSAKLRDWLGKAQYRQGEGRTGWVVKHNRTLRLPPQIAEADARRVFGEALTFADKYSDAQGPTNFHQALNDVTSFLAVPVRGVSPQGPPRAVLRITRQYRGLARELFTPEQQRLLEVAAHELAIALDQRQLAETQKQVARLEHARNVARQVSHALSNPALAIDSRLGELRRLLPEAPDNVKRVLQRMDDLIGQIKGVERDFRVLVGLTQPHLEPLDVVALARTTFEELLYEPIYILQVEAPNPPWPALHLDRGMTRIVLESLADNIRQIIRRTGLVRLQFTGPHEAKTEPVATMEQRYFLLTITDQGPGIPVGDKDMIFTDGFSRRMQGTGIGLFTARTRMHMMGGQILEDGPQTADIGARFRLAFPAAREEPTRE